MYSPRYSLWSILYLWTFAVEGTAQLIFSGSNVGSVPFHHLHEGFVKRGYLAYQGFSNGLTLTCTLPAESDGGLSIYKGPWSDPTPLVEDGEVVDSDPNLSHSMDSPGGHYRISFAMFSTATSGTYYCFTTVRVSDNVTRVEVSFAELVVQASAEMFCFIHRSTDSVIFTGESPATPIHCVTDLRDLQDRIPLSVDLIDPTTGDTTGVDLTASFLSDLMPIVFQFGEIIFDISSTDVANFDGFSVMCSRGMSSSNQCENIAPLDIYSNLTVGVSPENIILENRTSAEFTCITSPNVIGNVTWSISGLSESEQKAITLKALQTTEGSVLQLTGITFSSQGSKKDFVVTCDVSLGKGTSGSSLSTVTLVRGDSKDDQEPSDMDMNNNNNNNNTNNDVDDDDNNSGPQTVSLSHFYFSLTISCFLLIQRLTLCT